jgi:methionyl-tRNA synthetase
MALELDLPKTIFAHGWWTVDGEKMSKSRGNVVDPNAMIERFGTDAFRYFLLREVPFGHDGDFSQEALVGRINSDLANGLGNLLSRTLTLIERSTDGLVPQSVVSAETTLEPELRQACYDLLNTQLDETLPRLEFNRTLEAIWRVVQLANQYVDKTAPWALAKDPKDAPRLQTVLYHMAETIRLLGLSLYPFMPDTVNGLNAQLGLSNQLADQLNGPLPPTYWTWGHLKAGTPIQKGKVLFPRIEPNKPVGAKTVTDSPTPASTPTAPNTQPATTATSPAIAPATPPPAAAQITIDEFMKIQLKTAKVLTAERVPRSEKLIKLQVDLGSEQRQIVAGIGKKYEPEQLVGRSIVIVANLKPAKLMGIESQGMVLAAGDAEVKGLVGIVEDVDPGTKVK